MGTYLAQPITEKNLISKQSFSRQIKFTLCEMQGWRRQMEDAAVCQTDLGDGNSLFAVFDGHGGSQVSTYLKDFFAKTLLTIPEYWDKKYDQALSIAFQTIESSLASDQGEQYLSLLSSRKNVKTNRRSGSTSRRTKISDRVGCTAHVVLITKNHFIVANSGDSRSILCRNGECYGLSIDHKPDYPGERERILKAGGNVLGGRINKGLNISRSFGDFAYKNNENLPSAEQMVIFHPEIRVFQRSPSDNFILIGCDGVFEKFYNNEQPLVRKINKYKKNGMESEELMAKLFDSLLAKTSKQENGCDNMTSILVQFIK